MAAKTKERTATCLGGRLAVLEPLERDMPIWVIGRPRVPIKDPPWLREHGPGRWRAPFARFGEWLRALMSTLALRDADRMIA